MRENWTESFPRWLRSALDSAGMTRSELAWRIGSSPSHISRWLYGECHPQERMRRKVEGVLFAPRVPPALRNAYALRAQLISEIAKLEAELALTEYEYRLAEREAVSAPPSPPNEEEARS